MKIEQVKNRKGLLASAIVDMDGFANTELEKLGIQELVSLLS